jgi:hypothetical protein
MFGKYVVSALAVTVSAALIALCLVVTPVQGYRICTFRGTVIDHGWRSMTVKSGNQCAVVNVGWRTKYLPNRRPCLGEAVAVDFLLEDGYMKATKVVSLSPLPAQAQCYPPPPPVNSTCRTVPEEAAPAAVTEGCVPPQAVCTTRPPSHALPGWSPGKKEPAPKAEPKPAKKPTPEAKVTKPKPTPEPGEPAPPGEKQEFKSLTGEVVASSPKSLSVRVAEEGESAEVVAIRVGLKTKFIPFRRPAVGERVKIDYRAENGEKFGYTVQVVQ